ncbi:hypothetical protein Aph01nite_69160 [Acrocarpospora phusangensis]|uniref:Tat pathway signal sequence domain protein n=1 Tax=Acrocarpospora phusangensis TaxID=1070424 RepID=A0A919UNK4_9ACTN|nr:hypothetical protein [Acrocarpospora phusangensis]GIH28606.1 hypothetical protein Aph01nite_69160 [Acrocarpospora phusangensis]
MLSRRHFVAASVTAAAAPLVLSRTASATGLLDHRLSGSADRALGYLNTVLDAYAQGSEPRLAQSYNNESGLMTTAFVYDNALAVIAYLSRPTRENVRRAKVIGDTFLWIQANDETFTDGRVRQAYAAGPMLFYGGGPEFTGVRRADGKAGFLWPFGFGGSAVGDVAWTALALTHLYDRTRERRYLDGAVALGEWIEATSVSPYRHGGYLGGVQGDGTTKQRWCSSEHNIDVYALFHGLAKFTGNRVWKTRARVAGDFLDAMWNPRGRFYWTGTLGANPADDPNEINPSPIPEDVQTWAYLARGDRGRAIDWTTSALATTDRGGVSENSQLPAGYTVSGVTFSDVSKTLTGPVPSGTGNNNRDAVWFEGTAHVAAALAARGDRREARGYLGDIASAQDALGAGQTVGRTADPNGGRLSNPGEGGTWTGTALPARSGVVAASSAFDTGFGFGYFQNQHVGATSWYLMAALGTNPYRF